MHITFEKNGKKGRTNNYLSLKCFQRLLFAKSKLNKCVNKMRGKRSGACDNKSLFSFLNRTFVFKVIIILSYSKLFKATVAQKGQACLHFKHIFIFQKLVYVSYRTALWPILPDKTTSHSKILSLYLGTPHKRSRTSG